MGQQKYSVETSLPAVTNPTWTGFGWIRKFKVRARWITTWSLAGRSSLLY